MKKCSWQVLLFVFMFLFAQSFVLAEEKIIIENLRIVPSVLSSIVSFKPTSDFEILSCKITLNSSDKLLELSVDTVNASQPNRIKLNNLSSSTNYAGKIICFGLDDIIGESDSFQFTTLNRTNELNKIVQNETNISVAQTEKAANLSSVKNIVLGISIGLGLLLIFGGLGLLFKRKK